METGSRFNVCASCSVVVSYGDESGITDADTLHTVQNNIEVMGNVALMSELADETIEYFDCFVCDQVVMSERRVFESI